MAPDPGPRSNRLLAALSPDDYAALAPYLRPARLRRGEALIEPGEPVGQLLFPHDCVVSLVAVLEDGGTAETGTVGREGVLGLVSGLGGRRPIARAVVRVPGTASRIDAARFHAAFEARPGVRRLSLGYAGALVAQMLQTAACNAHHRVEARLARWLLVMHDRVAGSALPLTHEFMAEMLASSGAR